MIRVRMLNGPFHNAVREVSTLNDTYEFNLVHPVTKKEYVLKYQRLHPGRVYKFVTPNMATLEDAQAYIYALECVCGALNQNINELVGYDE